MSRALKSLAIFFAVVVIYTLSRHGLSSTTTTTTTTTTVASSTTSSTSPGGTTCTGSDFHGAYNQGQGAAGTVFASITLTKVTLGQCQVKGWPLLTLQDRLGAPLASTTVRDTSSGGYQFLDARANRPPALLVLRQGSSTTFSLAYSSVAQGTSTCPAAQTVSVAFAAGGSTTPVTPDVPPTPCNGGRVTVSPFY